MSKSKITASESLHNELKTDCSTTRPSIPMSKHSSIQDARSFIEGVSMLSVEGSRARTSQAQEKAQESPESDQAYGPSWQESFAQFDRDSHSWKTRQCSLLGGLEPFSETWPRWCVLGAHHAGGHHKRDRIWILAHASGERLQGSKLPPTLRIDGGGQKAHGPISQCGGVSRPDVVWPTPTNCGNYNRKGASPISGDGLATAVKQWPTPSAGCHTGGPTGLAGGSGNRKKLYDMLGEEEGKKMGCGQLNPDWVEWLMGWPIGWTGLEPIEKLQWLDWSTDPADTGDIPRVSKGIKHRVSRLKAIGNGQVPAVAAMAWEILTSNLDLDERI